MTYILHIETATKSCSVALSLDGKQVELIEEHGDQFVHGEKLGLFIQELFLKSGVAISQLSAVSISIGPGSYTGLRIGLALAKGISFANSIPIIAIDTLKCYENCAREKIQSKICVMIDARRMEVYSSIFDEEGQLLKQPSADILDESTYAEYEPFTCVGDGCEKMKELWLDRSIQFNDEVQISAKGQIELAYKKFLNAEFEDLTYLEPNYIKEFYSG